MSYGLPGPGRHVTIYANAGHAYMVVDHRRFDTSAIGETGSRWTSTHRGSSGYAVRHPRASSRPSTTLEGSDPFIWLG